MAQLTLGYADRRALQGVASGALFVKPFATLAAETDRLRTFCFWSAAALTPTPLTATFVGGRSIAVVEPTRRPLRRLHPDAGAGKCAP